MAICTDKDEDATTDVWCRAITIGVFRPIRSLDYDEDTCVQHMYIYCSLKSGRLLFRAKSETRGR